MVISTALLAGAGATNIFWDVQVAKMLDSDPQDVQVLDFEAAGKCALGAVKEK